MMAHVIKATAFEREDGMQAIRVSPTQWVIRAPIAGQTQFWNGSGWVVSSLIERPEGAEWPAQFVFSQGAALAGLEILEAP
jgi:hypothetical protein